MANPREVIVESQEDILSPILLDDGNVYWTTHSSSGAYTNDVTFSIHQVPKSGGTPSEVFSQINDLIEMVAYTPSAYYIRVWLDTDTKSLSKSQSIIALLAHGAGQYTPVAADHSFNVGVAFAQTSTTLYFQNHKNSSSSDINWLYGFDLPGGSGYPLWREEVRGRIRHATVENDVVRLVLHPSQNKPTLHVLTRNGGLYPGVALPEMCSGIVRRTSHLDWIGLCGQGLRDVVRFDDWGAMETMATNVVTNWLGNEQPVLLGSDLYWYYSKAPSVRSLNIETMQMKMIPLQKEDEVFAFDDAFVYFKNGSQILRSPLASAIWQ
ncbi:MAG: hypothetical protein FWD57_08770 [Polyangiaceae bacterium]|nr:hypothetical protein [Polyangiaceae bacterium]